MVVDDVDVERHRSLEIVEETPGVQSRCIGILTKCDRKQTGSDRWVSALFASTEKSRRLTGQMPTLLRSEQPSVPHLEHGWFGIRNRLPGETGVTDAERDENEANEFSKPEWESVPSHRKGINVLMDYVDMERRNKLHRQIPQIIAEIR